MFPPKKKPGAMPPGKKPGLDVMIAVGKKAPGGDDDLGSPDPVEGMSKGPKPPAPHEADESQGDEQQEEYGKKLLDDIDNVGQEYGMDSATTREFTASLFEAVVKCLRGESGGGEEGSGESQGEDDYGAQG